jgi:hypothetical protein
MRPGAPVPHDRAAPTIPDRVGVLLRPVASQAPAASASRATAKSVRLAALEGLRSLTEGHLASGPGRNALGPLKLTPCVTRCRSVRQ